MRASRSSGSISPSSETSRSDAGGARPFNVTSSRGRSPVNSMPVHGTFVPVYMPEHNTRSLYTAVRRVACQSDNFLAREPKDALEKLEKTFELYNIIHGMPAIYEVSTNAKEQIADDTLFLILTSTGIELSRSIVNISRLEKCPSYIGIYNISPIVATNIADVPRRKIEEWFAKYEALLLSRCVIEHMPSDLEQNLHKYVEDYIRYTTEEAVWKGCQHHVKNVLKKAEAQPTEALPQRPLPSGCSTTDMQTADPIDPVDSDVRRAIELSLRDMQRTPLGTKMQTADPADSDIRRAIELSLRDTQRTPLGTKMQTADPADSDIRRAIELSLRDMQRTPHDTEMHSIDPAVRRAIELSLRDPRRSSSSTSMFAVTRSDRDNQKFSTRRRSSSNTRRK